MFERVLQQIQEKVGQQQYVMTLHAEEEMEDDNLCIDDIEHGILTGIILERQSDRRTNEWKYRICGRTIDSTALEVIAKLGMTSKVVSITVYLLWTSHPFMICDYCGQKGARIRHIPRTYGRGDNLLVIENVPVTSCPHCGESYLSAETLHQIDQIKRNRKVFTIARPVEVAVFD